MFCHCLRAGRQKAGKGMSRWGREGKRKKSEEKTSGLTSSGGESNKYTRVGGKLGGCTWVDH